VRNAEVSAKGQLPFCQDTGTAIVVGKKGQAGLDWRRATRKPFRLGVYQTYTEEKSALFADDSLSMYEEKNSGQISRRRLISMPSAVRNTSFCSSAKGGGSATRRNLFQENQGVVDSAKSWKRFLIEKMKTLGTAACPPYHIAFRHRRDSAEDES